MRTRFTLTMLVLALMVTTAFSAGCSAEAPAETNTSRTVTAANSASGGMGGGMGGSSGSGGSGGDSAMVNGVVAAARYAGLKPEDVRGTSAGIMVDSVVAPRAGWLVARSINPPYSVLGTATIEQGENTDVLIRLTAADSADAYVALHIDRGTPGVFEFDPDRPRQTPDAAVYVNSAPVQVPVRVTGFGEAVLANSVLVLAKDQAISNRTLLVDYLLSPQPVWIRVNLLEGGLPGKQLGVIPRPMGEQQSIIVPLSQSVQPGDVLVVTAHADRGLPGTFEFDASDPLSGADQPFVAAGVLVSQRLTVQ